MRIAIIGSGISGIVAAHELCERHEITLFEAGDYLGGHTHTVDVSVDGENYAIDTGFIVFNDRTYPNFQRLLDRYGVRYQPTAMSFSVKNDRNGWEYSGSSLRGLFAQQRNLVRPGFWRMVRDILRFNRQAPESLTHSEQTVGEFLRRQRYSPEFAENYLLAMGAAIWSCPQEEFAEFPMRFIARFFHNHGLLSLRDRPQWYVISGGSREYVRAFTAPFRERIRLRTPVLAVRRVSDAVEVSARGAEPELFDHVVFACHSDQALGLLTNPTRTERDVLSHFPYGQNSVVLHTDESLLPRRRRAWSAWNYHVRRDRPAASTVTYNMNILQGIRSRQTFCVTLNEDDLIDPRTVLGRYRYAHPLFTLARETAQSRRDELIDHDRISYCGAYWGNGFHEDGVNSALTVAQRLEHAEAQCTAACMKAGSAIGVLRR